MVNEKKRSQREDVLNYLKTNGAITSMQAIQMFGATRLSSIIYNLRKSGYAIDSVPMNVKNRYGRTARVTKYIYVGRTF